MFSINVHDDGAVTVLIKKRHVKKCLDVSRMLGLLASIVPEADSAKTALDAFINRVTKEVEDEDELETANSLEV